MAKVELPDELRDTGLTHVSEGQCLDCGRDCSVYTDAVPGQDKPGQAIVVHDGVMCRGFRARFTPSDKRPNPSPACDHTGTMVRKDDEDRKSRAVTVRPKHK